MLRALVSLLLAAVALSITAPPSIVLANQSNPTRTVGHVSPQTDHELREALGRARRATGVKGLTFAVMSDNGRGWTGATGVAASGSPIGLETPLVIGSVTKTFVAGIVLNLAEQGRLKLDDPISSYVANTARVAPGVTVRQLLNHTSGVADLYAPLKSRLARRPDHVLSARDVLGAVGAPRFKPGAGWSYSNTNYFLLGLVAERVTAQPFADLLQASLAGPLGLSHTSLPDTAESRGAGLPPAWSSSFWTSGAMVSTASDLARWAVVVYGTNRYVGGKSRNALVTINSKAYGLGTQQMTLAGRTGWGHSGLLYSNTALMLYFPADRIGIAIIANGANVNLNWALSKRVNGDPSLLELARRFAAP